MSNLRNSLPSRVLRKFKGLMVLKQLRKQTRLYRFWIILLLIFTISILCFREKLNYVKDRGNILKKLISFGDKSKGDESWCRQVVNLRPRLNSNTTNQWIILLLEDSDHSLISKLIGAIDVLNKWTLLILETPELATRDTLQNYVCPRCIYLTANSQKLLDYEILKVLSPDDLILNPSLRKNIGYLYAVQSGARYIYTPNTWVEALHFMYEEKTSGASAVYDKGYYQGLSIYPPSEDTVESPRAFRDLYQLLTHPDPLYLHSCLDYPPSVQYILSNAALVSWAKSQLLSQFDSILTPVIDTRALSNNSYYGIIIYEYSSIWSLLKLPYIKMTPPTDPREGNRDPLLYHNSLIQKTFGRLNLRSLVIRKRYNMHTYDDSEPPSTIDNEFTRVSGEVWDVCWNIHQSPIECWRDIVDQVDALSPFRDLYRAWILDLLTLNYTLLCSPSTLYQRSGRETHSHRDRGMTYGGNPCQDTDYTIRGSLTLKRKRMDDGDPLWNADYCQLRHHLRAKQQDDLSKVVLLVTFNYPYYDLIPSLNYLYGNIFKTIVYCGEHFKGAPNGTLHGPWDNYDVNFVSVSQTNRGFFLQSCLAKVLNMRLGTESALGYLYISDDVLLNVPMFNTLDLTGMAYVNFGNDDKLDSQGRKKQVFRGPVGYPGYSKIADVAALMRCRNWDIGNERCGNSLNVFVSRITQNRQRILKALTYLKTTGDNMEKLELSNEGKATFDRDDDAYHLANCYKTLLARTGGHPGRVFYGEADIFYIPSRLSKPMLAVIKVFLRFNVMLEIAVATAMACIEGESQTQNQTVISDYPGNDLSSRTMTYFRYNHYWNKKRSDILTLITRLRYSLYMHPFKFRQAQLKYNMTNQMICDILQKTNL